MNGFIQHQAFLFSDFYLYHDTHKRSILKLLPLESEVFSRYWSLVLISGNIWKKKKYVIKSCFPSVVLRSRLVYCKRAFVRLSRNWDVFPRWPLGVFHNLPLQEWFCKDKPWGKLQLDPWKGWPLGYCNSICNSDSKLPQPWLDRQTAHFWGGKKENQRVWKGWEGTVGWGWWGGGSLMWIKMVEKLSGLGLLASRSRFYFGLCHVVNFNQNESETIWKYLSFTTLVKMPVSHMAASILMGETTAKMAVNHMFPLRLPTCRFLTINPGVTTFK